MVNFPDTFLELVTSVIFGIFLLSGQLIIGCSSLQGFLTIYFIKVTL